MWESLLSHPRGRLSTRKYISIATAFLVVCFAYIFIAAPTALAADASWDNGSIVYENNTYKGPTVSKGTESHNLPKDVQIYEYVEITNTASGGSTQKAHLIYFPSGTDPTTATTASYKTYTLRSTGRYSDPSAVTSISLEKPSAAPANPGTSSCVVEGIGWIICPITNFLAKGMDLIYGWVSGFLKVAPLATSQDQALYRAWGYMRTFANIAFIIGFLVIIYSQISNVGLSNYDIKKMLPRIVVAAILVNTSYWICAVAVDIFNILGYSVQDLFIMMRNSLVGSEGNSWEVISWESMSALILSGGSLAAAGGIGAYLGIASVGSVAGVGGLIFLLLPLLLSVLFVVLMTFLILAARQAIITIFIIIAPLAFVAFLLPNTEKWFEKWRSAFFTLLLLFPAFSLVFGGAQLAAAAIIQNAKGADALNMIILGMAVQVAPLAITPLLLKLGGGVLNRFAGIVNNPTKGIFDRGKNWSKERLEANQAHKMKRMSRDPVTRNRRFSASRVAFNRDQSKRAREGWKAKNEAYSAGVFSNTASGIKIYGAGEEAKLQQSLGDSRGHEAWNRRVYGSQALRTLSNQQIAAQHTGDIYHEEVQNTGKEAFEHTLHGNAALRQVKINAHTAEGRAKLHESNLAANAEMQLQNQIEATPYLTALKVEEVGFQGRSDLAKSRVDALGKRQFADDSVNDQALRRMKIGTVAIEKEAGSMESVLQKMADANWDSVSRRDPQLRKLRLRESEAGDQAKKAEEMWNTLIADIHAEGSATPGLTAQDARIANSIQGLTRDIEIQSYAQNSAKIKQQGNLASAFKDDEVLRNAAGGIGGEQAANRIYAKAKKDIISIAMEDIDNSRSLISEYTQKQLVRLHREGIDKDGRDVGQNEALVFAAMQELALNKGNNWALQKLRDHTVTKYGMVQEEDSDGNVSFYDTQKDEDGNIAYDSNDKAIKGGLLTEKEVSDRRDAQQLVADAIKKSPLKVASISQTDISELDSGTSVTDGRQAIIRDIVQGKFDQEKIASLDVDELQRMVTVLRDSSVRDRIDSTNPEALQRLLKNIDGAQINDQVRGRIKDRERGVMFALASYLDPVEQNRNIDQYGHPEKIFYSEELPNGAVIRKRPGEEGAEAHEAPVVPPQKYVRDEFFNSKGRGPDGTL